MIVYHLTPKGNVSAILWEGLRIKKAIGVPRVWFFTPRKREWARKHIAKHHHCTPDDLIELRVNVPRGWLMKWRASIWLCYRDVPSERIEPVNVRRRITDFLEGY